MDIIEAIQKRYSCRSYHDKPVEKEKLDLVFEAARIAPSAKNLQDWRFVAVTDPETRTKLRAAANNQPFIEQAPVVIAACSISDEVMRCGQAVAPIDVSIALDHITLQASQLGLATCWVGSFYPDKVRPILGIPENVEIVELMALGYPADQQPPRKRQPLGQILSYEKWRF